MKEKEEFLQKLKESGMVLHSAFLKKDNEGDYYLTTGDLVQGLSLMSPDDCGCSPENRLYFI